MYAVHQSNPKRRTQVLVTGATINIRLSRALAEQDLMVEVIETDIPSAPTTRSHNLSRWPNKHRVEKMGKRRGRKCRK